MQGLRSALTPWRALLLAALLLSAQAAGLVHGVAHSPAAHAATGVTAYWGHAAPDAHAPAGTEAAAECRLYDQLLGHADALIGTPPPTAELAITAAAPLPGTTCLHRSTVAAYQARAPPLA
jgi:hypothetical protein